MQSLLHSAVILLVGLSLGRLSAAKPDPDNPGKVICYTAAGRELANNTQCPGSKICCSADHTCLPERLCQRPSLEMIVPPCEVWPWTDECSQICQYDLGVAYALPRAVNCTDGSTCCNDDRDCCAKRAGVFLKSNGEIASYGVSYTGATSSITTTTSVPASTTSSRSSTTAVPRPTQSSSSSTSSGLSTGAKAGIGVGVSLAALILLAVAAVILIRRRERSNAAHQQPLQQKSIPEMDSLVNGQQQQQHPSNLRGPQEISGDEIYQIDGSEPHPPPRNVTLPNGYGNGKRRSVAEMPTSRD